MTKGSKNMDPEEVLQAVIIADSFNSKFKPLTLETPRCLIPLCNTPILDYTLSMLAGSGVQEIFIVTCSQCERIADWLR